MTFIHYAVIVLSIACGILSAMLIKVNKENENVIRASQRAINKYDYLCLRYEKMRKALFEVVKLKQNLPEDCKRGPWCLGCTFVKKYTSHIDRFETMELSYCGKEEACEHFIQKEEAK